MKNERAWMSPDGTAGLLSVIVPTCNRARYLPEALESAWLQSYRPIELIVVDDGSTDETSDLIARWDAGHRDDDQFHFQYIHQDNAGAPAARNRGLIASRGEYIQFLDSDDVLVPAKAMRAISGMKATGADFANANCTVYNEALKLTRQVYDFSEREHTPAAHVRHIAMNTGSPVLKRGVAVANGPWSTDLLLWQDFEYMFRVLAAGWRGTWIQEVHYKARATAGITQSSFTARHAASCRLACRLVLETAQQRNVVSDELLTNLGKRLAWVMREAAVRGNISEARAARADARPLMRGRDRFKMTLFSIASCVLGLGRACRIWKTLGSDPPVENRP